MGRLLDICRIWASKGWGLRDDSGDKFVDACLRCAPVAGPLVALNIVARRTDRMGAFTSNAAMAKVFRSLPRTPEACADAMESLDPPPNATVAQMVLKAVRSMDWRDEPAGPADEETLLAAAELMRDHGAEDTVKRFERDYGAYLDERGTRLVSEILEPSPQQDPDQAEAEEAEVSGGDAESPKGEEAS
eukprot:scaffold1620_cov233-Pinguiococcus_pyrenoidosus.AAC.3